jgi:3'-5' exoribonuclease
MFFEQNLTNLNKLVAPHNLHFEKRGSRLILIEEVPRILNSLSNLKEQLKQKYSLRFDWNQKVWYIGHDGIKRLSERKMKCQPSRSSDALKQKLSDYVGQISDPQLRSNVEQLLSDFPYYFDCPGAKRFHHAYKHGLLEHTVQIIELCFGMINTFDDGIRIDPDLVIVGAILHDVGKINCYQFVEGAIDTTPLIAEHDHIVNGIKLASQYITAPQLDKLIHIIASHHKEKNYGSPVTPITNEAWLINTADDLSSKIMG